MLSGGRRLGADGDTDPKNARDRGLPFCVPRIVLVAEIDAIPDR